MTLFSNKRGTVFHYALIGIFAALGIAFLFYNQSIGMENFILGQWESNFADNYFYEGEKVQIQEDIVLNYHVLQAVNSSARNGGYAKNSIGYLECGSNFNLPVLNLGSKSCFGQFSSEVASEFSQFVEERGQFADGFEVTVTENKLDLESEGGIKILPGDAELDLSDEELSCLEEDNVPIFSGNEEYERCDVCPESGCERYINQFYCDLDPCDLECVSYYSNNDGGYKYSKCDTCPEEAECSRYINQYYCETDLCSLGCKWEVNNCVDSGKDFEDPFESMNIIERAKIVSNPEIYTQNTQYTIDYSFSYDLNEYYEDYQKVVIEAYSLINSCLISEDLEECLNDEKEDHWEYGICGEGSDYQEDLRQVPFCVMSPNSLTLVSLTSTAYDLEYNFALDFSPSEAFVVEVNSIEYDSDTNVYDLFFTPQDTATSYNIYVTDYELPTYQGSVSQFELQLFRNVFEKREVLVESMEMTCPEPAETFTLYECAGPLRYVIDLNEMIEEGAIEGEEYYFTVTSLIGDSESQIDGFEYI
tara:strand:- start:4 stop:1599 length:1596 start_codon:yes stop_codon:yes gene_type:complete